ncbi:right-handed parallel beta-helix repeat-containing protein [Priestia aryabhattai]|uniref:right-handed parallel beta-helix repeat-containing protein n=1 Tax=Priestia aryabhattai TaxID=412384 RepID=UPI0035AB9C1F
MRKKGIFITVLFLLFIGGISSLIFYNDNHSSRFYVENYRNESDVDDGLAIQRAIAAAKAVGGGIVILDNKSYTISFTGQELPSNVILKGSGKKTKIISTKTGELFHAFNKENIEIRKIAFQGINNNTVMLSTNTTDGILIKKCTFTNIRIIRTDLPSGESYATADETKLSKNITITDNKATGANKTLSRAAIELAYVKNVKVRNNKISQYKHGIQWWGGDANPSKNGALNNPRWARDITISKNTVDDIDKGGIWGSMGYNITVSDGNRVSNCGDVGIDFEGSISSNATDNYVKNCKNGCIVTFFQNKDILITENVVESDVDGQYLFRIFNSSHAGNQSIKVVDNKFRHTGSGIGYVGGEQVDVLDLSDNIFTNTAIHLYSTNFKKVTVSENNLSFTQTYSQPFNALRVRSLIQEQRYGLNPEEDSSFIISDNAVRSLVEQLNRSRAIYVEMNENNLPEKAIVEDNKTEGFPIDVEYYVIDSPTGRTLEFILRYNTLANRNFIISKGSTTTGQVIIEGNRDKNGKPYNPVVR